MTSELTIARARRGDPDALGELYRAHHPAILRYLRATGLGDAEDLGAQVWIDAARTLPRFRGDDTDLRRWLFTIARRRMIDAHRSRSRRPEVLAGDALPVAAAPGADAAHDEPGRATELLALLPPAQAEVVMLRVVLDMSVDEVATIVDRSPGAVRVLAHRGLERLRVLLQQDATAAEVGRTAHFAADPDHGVTPDPGAAMNGTR